MGATAARRAGRRDPEGLGLPWTNTHDAGAAIPHKLVPVPCRKPRPRVRRRLAERRRADQMLYIEVTEVRDEVSRSTSRENSARASHDIIA
jgi:hypothetical protein